MVPEVDDVDDVDDVPVAVPPVPDVSVDMAVPDVSVDMVSVLIAVPDVSVDVLYSVLLLSVTDVPLESVAVSVVVSFFWQATKATSVRAASRTRSFLAILFSSSLRLCGVAAGLPIGVLTIQVPALTSLLSWLLVETGEIRDFRGAQLPRKGGGGPGSGEHNECQPNENAPPR